MKKSLLISLVFFLAVSFTSKHVSAMTLYVHVWSDSQGGFPGQEVVLQSFDGQNGNDLFAATDMGEGWYRFDYDIPQGQNNYRVRVGGGTFSGAISIADFDFTVEFHYP